MTIWTSIGKKRKTLAGKHAVIAVSGGADSMAMLIALNETAPLLKIRLTVAHFNHHIRGKAAAADARFVKQIANKLELPFVIGELDVPKLARRDGISIEMAARKARYDFLARTVRKLKADAIATAHTADDQAETILLKLARGSGPRGLSGIPRETRINGVPVIRPLLDVTRAEIEAFLLERKQPWREDKTNRDLSYLRNRVRHEILPLLESNLNPKIRETLVKTADIMREEDQLLDQMARKALSKIAAPISRRTPGKTKFALNVVKLRKYPLALRRRVISLWLGNCDVPAEAIDFDGIARVEKLAEQKEGSGQVDVALGWIITRRHAILAAVRGNKHTSESRGHRPVAAARKVRIPGRTVLKRAGLVITTSLNPGLMKQGKLRIGEFPAFASLRLMPLDKIRLLVRSWRHGDRMEPFGMNGSKKLQDIFVDGKIPVDERGDVPVFECKGRIVWIPGYRVASGWEVENPGDVALQIRVERNRRL